jgi:hypothetical protein
MDFSLTLWIFVLWSNELTSFYENKYSIKAADMSLISTTEWFARYRNQFYFKYISMKDLVIVFQRLRISLHRLYEMVHILLICYSWLVCCIIYAIFFPRVIDRISQEKFFSSDLSNLTKYSQTCLNDHLWITATCQQRPICSPNGQPETYLPLIFFIQPSA